MNSIYDQKIIDAHIHLWNLQINSYDWISRSLNKNLKKNYLLNDFIKDYNLLNVIKCVHIEGGINAHLSINETKWLQSLADNNSLGFPNAIIGFLDLTKLNIQDEIDQHSQYANFRGVRQILKFNSKLQLNDENLLSNNKWIENLHFLEKKNLSFDLLINYYQFGECVKIIRKYPNLQFIINHALWPIDITEDSIFLWQKSIKTLSQFENVAIKLSGFGEREVNWKLETIRPFINYSIEKFQIHRCMFGSNFPVDKVASLNKYFDYWNAYFQATLDFSIEEKNSIFYQNAEKFYKI